MKHSQLPIILALGTTQTLAWASSYYLPAILADPIARELGISSNWFFAACSASLVGSGLLGPRVGRQIDRVPVVVRLGRAGRRTVGGAGLHGVVGAGRPAMTRMS